MFRTDEGWCLFWNSGVLEVDWSLERGRGFISVNRRICGLYGHDDFMSALLEFLLVSLWLHIPVVVLLTLLYVRLRPGPSDGINSRKV
jgi:hypothetical protein